MAGTTNELLFHDEVQNVIGCLEFWIKTAKENLAEDTNLTEEEMVLEDSKKALEFLYQLISQ